MDNLKFTKEEAREIRKTLNIALDDMRELWKISQVEKIEVSVHRETGDDDLYYLTIDDNYIRLSDIIHDDSIILEHRGPFGIARRTNNIDVAFKFLKGYQEIRNKVENSLKDGLKAKGRGFEALDDVRKKYDKEALIEIDLPESNNQHAIEVTKEEGRTIGTIDFGNRSIRIITDGDISLVNLPNYLPKIKRK